MKKYILVITLLSIFPLVNLFHSGLPITHDGQDHVARIANFYQSLSEGNIVPRWAGNLNWGYGHPILMFLYPLPSYIGAFFHLVGFSFVDSTKLVFAVAYVASVLTMYLWAGSVWGKLPGFVAAVLYGFAPYRFVDLYVRGAIGEHVAFVFLPVVLWGIYANKPVAIAVFTAALILSHNALSIMFLPIIFLYAVYQSRDWKTFIQHTFFIGTGFVLSAFFWIPAFVEGKYTLREIVTTGQFTGRYVPLLSFMYSSWSYGGSDLLSKSLGWAQVIVIGISCTQVNKKRVLITGTLLILVISLFIMTSWSDPLWQRIHLLQNFQFPWRFLSVSVFASAVLGGIVTSFIKKKQIIFAAGISLLAVVGTVTMWHAREYRSYPETFFTGVYHGTTDTGESSPIWSVRFMEREANATISVINGEASIKPIIRTTTKHTYRIVTKSKIIIVENTLYFPGWNVYVDGVSVPVEFQNPQYRGLMTFDVPEGEHGVELIFSDTKLRKASNAISLSSLVVFILVLGTMPLWRKRK